MPKSHSLSINLPGVAPDTADSNGLRNPKSPRSPPSPLPVRQDPAPHEHAEGYDLHLRSPITSLPTPPSPHSPKHKTSRSLFTSIKPTKSTSRTAKPDTPSASGPTEPFPTSDSAGKIYGMQRSPGSTPDLSLHPDQMSSKAEPTATSAYAEAPESYSAVPSKSNSVPHISSQLMPNKEHDRRRDDRKPKFPRLGRRGSLKDDESLKTEEDSSNGQSSADLHAERPVKPTRPRPEDMPLRTAPLDRDRGFRDMMSSTLRNRSADRYLDAKNESSDDNTGVTQARSTRSNKTSKVNGKEDAASGFLSAIGNRAAGGLGRAAKGLAKLGRSGSTNEKEVAPAPKEPYVPRIITLPLVEQTRTTRISKRLEDCRDKTEFWMPALPWRCIDYLNAKAPNSEGIYRVPGSDRDVKHWEQRFDKEYDIDLLNPDTPIYDINTIGSMLKNWLRALPDTIVPTSIQNEVQAAVTANGSQAAPDQAPQELKDALSTLPPFNYYLLFAITCHISLLNAHPETTKMHFTALRICLQPCLRISPLFFQWLVQDWRNCWQGCWTEKEYLEREYAWLEEQEDAERMAIGTYLRDQQLSRASDRTPTPAGGREAAPRERERPKTSYKDTKRSKDDKGRPIQQSSKASQSSLPASNDSAHQFSASAPKSSVAMPPRHHHTSSVSSDRTPTAHAPLSTPSDAIQAAHAAALGDRAISSSGSSKPSVLSYSADGRSTPDTQQVRDGTPQAKARAGSRDRAREQGLTLRIKESMQNGSGERTADKSINMSQSSEPRRRTDRVGKGDQENELPEGSGAAGSRLMAAPQISPVKPLSPIASLDIH